MTFKIYNVATGGTELWSSGQQTVGVAQGLFTYLLGSNTTLPDTIFTADSTRFLGITVGDDPEISPRTKITSAAYAYKALVSDTAEYAKVGGSYWEAVDSVLTTKGLFGIARGYTENVLIGDSACTQINLGGRACTTGMSSPYSSYYNCVVGGVINKATDNYSAVIGGHHNIAADAADAVVGGIGNYVEGLSSVICGGTGNNIDMSFAGIMAGINDTASGHASFIGAGEDNYTDGHECSIIGGYSNFVAGDYSHIPGGQSDTLGANADYSMAFGRNVYLNTAYRIGYFNSTYWGYLGINRDDNSGGIQYPIHVGTNTGNGNGAHLTVGGVWTNGSSREFKENFIPIDRADLFSSILRLQINSWNFRESDERHIGPIAEEFVAEFDVGSVRADGTRENQYLSAGDVAGVALLGVQELIAENQELRKTIEELKIQIEVLGSRR